MDDSRTHMYKKPTKTVSQALSRDHLTDTYTELNIQKVERLSNTQTDGLDPTYSQLNFPGNELPISNDEDPAFASGPREMPVTAQTGPLEEETKENIRNRSYQKICILCIVTSVLVAIVVGLSIYVTQIRQSHKTCDQNYQKLCQLLISEREQPCPQDWIRNKDRCYFISTLATSYDGAKNNCLNIDARLLEINSKEEKNFVSNALVHKRRGYWIGKCEDGKKASSLMYKNDGGESVCGTCSSEDFRKPCSRAHRFICEKRAHLFTDIPEKIRDLCQPSVDQT